MTLKIKKWVFEKERGSKKHLSFFVTFEDNQGKEYPPELVVLDTNGIAHCTRYSGSYKNDYVYSKLIAGVRVREVGKNLNMVLYSKHVKQNVSHE